VSAFGSGHDPRVLGSSPAHRAPCSVGSLLIPLPLPLLVFLLLLALCQINKIFKKKKRKRTQSLKLLHSVFILFPKEFQVL